MLDIGKVINGLECCATNRLRREDCEAINCTYLDLESNGCIHQLIRDALALLKAQEPETSDAPKSDNNVGCWYDITHNYTLEQVVNALKEQEPRVMTLEEVKQWCETHPHKQNPIWVEFQHGYGTDGWRVGLVNSGMLAWCKDNEARCWTSRPNEKRRAEIPWN